jgi:hypothetical protein
MTFNTIETSKHGAKPYELYSFQATGVSFTLTAAENPITYLGQVYSPTAITRTEVEQSNEVISGQVKIYLPKNHPLAQMLIPYLPSSQMAVTVYASHYGDTDTVVLFTGYVASARFTDQCEIVCNSAQYLLQRKIPTQLYQSPCSHIFGDNGCGIPLGAHTYVGTVTAIDATGTILTIPAFASLPDPLVAGFLKWGDEYRMIVAQAGAHITLISPMLGLQAPASVDGTAGCNLDFASCSHYANTINFLGFDLIPVINPFDGSASVG